MDESGPLPRKTPRSPGQRHIRRSACRSSDEQLAQHSRMQPAEVRLLTLTSGDIATAVPLEKRASVPPGFPRSGRRMRKDVSIDPDDGVPYPEFQCLRVKRHSADFHDMPLSGGIVRLRTGGRAGEYQDSTRRQRGERKPCRLTAAATHLLATREL